MRKQFAALLIASVAVAACSGKGSPPTAPSNPPAATTPTGPSTGLTATISGSVQHASGGSVSVAGTSATTSIDGTGRFMLAGVQTGDLQLQIATSGGGGMVPLSGVQPSQIVEVVVAVAGASATLESEVRHGAGEAELKGTVDALPPTTPPLTFTAAGKTVRTDASTVFVSGTATKSFANLKLGMRVEAEGTLSGDTLTATRVELENVAEPPKPEPQPEPVPAELHGTIAGLTGSASAFQFMLGTKTVKGDASTVITGGGDVPKTFAELKNGVTVEVNGTQQTGFVHAVRIHVEGPETEPGDGNDQKEVDVEGTLGAVTGTCPVISSSVGSTKFMTSASTRFEDAACSAFKAGDKVEVKGTRNSDGSIAVTRLQKED